MYGPSLKYIKSIKHKQALISFLILSDLNFAPSVTDPSFQLCVYEGPF